MRLLNHETGELLPGRCKATNLCRYCQTLYVVETSEMLALDAAEWAPVGWMVLTAREHLTRKDTYRHLEQLRRAARLLWPDVQWFVEVEFQRRGALHLNLVVKGVPASAFECQADPHGYCDDARCFRCKLARVWVGRVDAEPIGQWAGSISDAEGVVRYLQKTLSHGLKREQAPPIGWKGHRTSQTRGYLVRPASVMRQEAKRSLRIKRAIWRGVDGGTAELEATAAESVEWSLRHVRPGTAVETERNKGTVRLLPASELFARVLTPAGIRERETVRELLALVQASWANSVENPERICLDSVRRLL